MIQDENLKRIELLKNIRLKAVKNFFLKKMKIAKVFLILQVGPVIVRKRKIGLKK